MPDGDISLVVGAGAWQASALALLRPHSGRVALFLPADAQPVDLALLAAAGVHEVVVSVLGKSAAEHDYHAGIAGAHAAAIDRLEQAQRLGLTVLATTTVTRSNFRSLIEMVDVLATVGVAAWRMSLACEQGRAAREPQRMLPRLGMCVPHMLMATKQAQGQAIEVFIEGVALCAMGPYADCRLPTPPGEYVEVCEACGAREACVGISPAYRRRFGALELRKREAASLRAGDERARLAAVFAVPGGVLP